MPDDVPDYEQLFLHYFGMPLDDEGMTFLLRKARGMTCNADEAKDLVHDFLVDELFPQLLEWWRRDQQS